MKAERLIGVCTNPNGEGVCWPAKSTDEGCIQECDCKPDFYVAATAIEQEVERLEGRARYYTQRATEAGEYPGAHSYYDGKRVAYNATAARLRSLLQDGERDG